MCILPQFQKTPRDQGITCGKTEGKAEHPRASGLTVHHPADLPLHPFGFLTPSDGPHWLPSLPRTHACRWSSSFCRSRHSADAHSTSASEAWCPCQLLHLCLPSNLSNLFPTPNSRYHTLVQTASISLSSDLQLVGLPAPRMLHSIPCIVAKYEHTTLTTVQHPWKNIAFYHMQDEYKLIQNPLDCVWPLPTHPPCSASLPNSAST